MWQNERKSKLSVETIMMLLVSKAERIQSIVFLLREAKFVWLMIWAASAHDTVNIRQK